MILEFKKILQDQFQICAAFYNQNENFLDIKNFCSFLK